MQRPPNVTYTWIFDEFTPCSVSCGGGIQFRNVSCADRNTLEPAEINLCDQQIKPSSTERCGVVDCPAEWVVKDWSECSSPCGDSGVQTREVTCEQLVNGIPTIVDNCSLSNKPESKQECNKGITCAKWHTSVWKPVSSYYSQEDKFFN